MTSVIRRSGPSARQVALTIVDEVTQSGNETAADWLDQHFKSLSIPLRDRALINEIVCGTIRRILTLDWILSRYTFHRVKDHLLKNILRVGIYQLYFLDRLPAHAVVNEMVQIAKDSMGDAKARFVNAVLRRAVAKDVPVEETTLAKMPKTTQLRALSVAHSMPLWMLERWAQTYSIPQIRQICQAANATPGIFIRANTAKISLADLKQVLEKEGVHIEAAEDSRMLKIRPERSIESLESFRKGFFFVQDPTTLRIVDFMKPGPSERVLDVCAAPGGKAFFFEEATGHGENILALEKNPARLRLALENTARLASRVHWMAFDQFRCEAHGKFDKIMLDVPCSNQGVLGRRVEARWRLTLERLDKLRRIQLELLTKAASWVGPAGVLCYSTCSIDASENEGLINQFLKKHRRWRCQASLKILPEAGRHDGGFIARLVCEGDANHD